MVSDIRSYFWIQISLVSLICSKCLGGRFVVVLNFFCFPVHPTYLPTTAFAQTKPVSFFCSNSSSLFTPCSFTSCYCRRPRRGRDIRPALRAVNARRFAPHSTWGIDWGRKPSGKGGLHFVSAVVGAYVVLLLPAPDYRRGGMKAKNLRA